MANEKYKPQVPDIMEAIFDAGYLIFDLIAGILFFAFSKGNPLFILYGVLTLTLCGGDAFHLVPRIIRAVHGSNDKIKRQLGLGLQVSSITMTAFYIILLYIWKLTFPELTAPVAVEAMIWISCNHQNGNLRSSAKQLVFRRGQYETFRYQKRSFCSNRHRRNHSLRNFRQH